MRHNPGLAYETRLVPVASEGVMPPVKWAAQFISDLSLHIVKEDYEALEKIKAQSDEIDGIRATLLVNFGEGSEHNKYGIALKNEGTTHSLMMQVLEHLTKESTVVSVDDLEFSQTVPSRVGEEWRRDLVIGWRKEADAITAGEYWVRWTSPGGLYYWLHPIEGRWVGEPEQITMPTWPTRAKAEQAARNAARPKVDA